MNADTTDLQKITAVISDDGGNDAGMVTVRCDFISGSDALGCMVVLVGGLDNTTVTVNLTRDGSSACVIEALPSTMTFSHIIGFDIESDGSVGTLQVPGIITMTNSAEFASLCQPNEVTRQKPFSFLSEYNHIICHKMHVYKFVLSDINKLLN